jgi:hypothetical protein
MSTTSQPHRGITDLLGDLASDISTLFRKEVQLAKLEASEKVDQVVNASRGLMIGAVMGIGAMGVFMAAIVIGIAMLLMSAGMEQTLSYFVSALIVAVVVGGISAALVVGGLNSMKASNLTLDRTGRTLARGVETVKESF